MPLSSPSNLWYRIENPIEREINKFARGIRSGASNIEKNLEDFFKNDVQKPVTETIDYVEDTVYPAITDIASDMKNEGKKFISGVETVGGNFVNLTSEISQLGPAMILGIGFFGIMLLTNKN